MQEVLVSLGGYVVKGCTEVLKFHRWVGIQRLSLYLFLFDHLELLRVFYDYITIQTTGPRVYRERHVCNRVHPGLLSSLIAPSAASWKQLAHELA